MKIVISVLVLAALSGCASVADVNIESTTGYVSIPRGSDVCVVFPEDGRFEGKKYNDSGMKVGEIILKS